MTPHHDFALVRVLDAAHNPHHQAYDERWYAAPQMPQQRAGMVAGARRRVGRLYYGWYVVGACATIACVSWGLGFYGLGVYLTALRAQHGWSTSLISLATTSYYLAGAAGVLVVGGVIDRHGPRGVLAFGAVTLGGCIVALGYLTAPWQLFAVYLVMATGYASLGATAISATLIPWFRQQRGRAITLALTGPSFGGILVVPLFVAVAGHSGFRTAATIVATVLCSGVLLLVALVVRRRPEELGLLPDGAPQAATSDSGAVVAAAAEERRWSRAAALGSPRFWLLALPFALAVMVQVGFIVHQLAFLEPRLGPTRASGAIGLTTLAALAGRVVMGLLADRIERRTFAAACFAVQGAGLALMAALDAPAALYVGSAVLGLGVGVVITMPALLTGDEFGVASFGTIFAMVSAGMQLGVAAGPSLIGVARDRWGGYEAVLWLLVGVQTLAVGMVLAGRRFAPQTTPCRRGVDDHGR